MVIRLLSALRRTKGQMLTSDPSTISPISLAEGSIKAVSSNWGNFPSKGISCAMSFIMPPGSSFMSQGSIEVRISIKIVGNDRNGSMGKQGKDEES